MFYYWNTMKPRVITATEPGDYWCTGFTHPVTGCVKSDTVEVDLTYT